MRALTRAIERLYTAEDLTRLSAQGGRHELIRGVLRAMPPAGWDRMTYDLSLYAGQHVKEHDLGRCFAAETGFLIERDPDTVLAPDWAFVAKERLAEPAPSGYGAVIPDLVLKTWSPHDRKSEIADKIGRWLQAGVRIVWELYPGSRTVTAHRRRAPSRRLEAEETLTGEEVLPGFSLPLRRLFPMETKTSLVGG